MGKDNLRKETLKLKSEGRSNKEISKTLGIPLGTVYRWIKEDSQMVVKKQEEIYTNSDDWFAQAIEHSDEIAIQTKKLRLLLNKLLTQHLEGESLNSRMITALSTSLERHTHMEWRAKGLDFLEANRAIARVLSMGYEISDPTIVTTQE